MPGRFIDVVVEPHADIPDGCRLQFQAAKGEEPRAVSLIRYQPSVGPGGLFRVESRVRDGKPATAQAVSVENRGTGTSTLIWGGDRGLRLFRADAPDGHGAVNAEEPPHAESYLLLAAGAIVS